MDTPTPYRRVTIEEMRAAAAATGRLARVRLSPLRFDGPDHYRVAATVNYRTADGVDASVTEEAMSRELELQTPLWRFRPEQALAECAEAAALRAAFPAELGRLYTRDEPAAVLDAAGQLQANDGTSGFGCDGDLVGDRRI